jgi:hypothetical protein
MYPESHHGVSRETNKNLANSEKPVFIVAATEPERLTEGDKMCQAAAAGNVKELRLLFQDGVHVDTESKVSKLSCVCYHRSNLPRTGRRHCFDGS